MYYLKGWFWGLCNISTNLNIKWKRIKELDLCIAYTFLLTSYVRIWYMQVYLLLVYLQ